MRSCLFLIAYSVSGIFLPERLLFFARNLSKNCLVEITLSNGSRASRDTLSTAATVFFFSYFVDLPDFLGSLGSFSNFSLRSSGTSVDAKDYTESVKEMLLGGIVDPSPFHSALYSTIPTIPSGCCFLLLTAYPF